MINNIPQLIDTISKNKEVIFYGAGKVGRSTVDFLLNNYSIENVRAFLVSERDERQDLCTIPILQVDNLSLNKNTLVIITTKCILHDQIMEVLKQEHFMNIEALDDNLCDILINKYDVNYYDYRAEVKRLEDSIIRTMAQPRLHYIVLNILDHCNLNCRGCDHFAPLAKKRCIPYEVIERDVQRFSELMEKEVDVIGIMGGEPLLHPELLDIIEVVRKYFPKTRIQVDTNGILLLNQQDEFWEIIRNNKIVIVNTKYPINLNYEKIEQVCSEKKVLFEYYGNTRNVEKTLFKICMDTEGKQEPRSSFLHCSHANNCVTFMEGKVFPCTIAPNMHLFNEYYNTELELCKEDYIDIYSPNIGKKDILNFLSKPIPFCRYCDVEHRNYGYEWSISKKNISEWT